MPHKTFPAKSAFFALVLAVGAASPALAGKVVSSIRMPVGGELLIIDGPAILLDGVIHIVAQVFETSDGELMATIRYNLSQLDGEGDDGSRWIGVGADQYPPDPIEPGIPEQMFVPFELMMLSGGYPPDPVSPNVDLFLVFDEDGRLNLDLSEASIAPEY